METNRRIDEYKKRREIYHELFNRDLSKEEQKRLVQLDMDDYIEDNPVILDGYEINYSNFNRADLEKMMISFAENDEFEKAQEIKDYLKNS